MATFAGKPTYLDLGGYDLTSFLSDAHADPVQVSTKFDDLPDFATTINGYWGALPGITECSMTFVVPMRMMEPRARKRIALFLDPVGYRRRKRMRTAYHRRRR